MKLPLVGLLLCAALHSTTTLATQYHITDLGNELTRETLNLFPRDGLRIGPNGEVAGSLNGNLLLHDGTRLETIAPPTGFRVLQVKDIDSGGNVLVWLSSTTNPGYSRMATFNDGGYSFLGNPAAQLSYAFRLDGNGRAIGYEVAGSGSARKQVIMDSSGSIELEPLPAGYNATTINASGTIGGGTPQWDDFQFFFKSQTGVTESPNNLSLFDGFLHDMNDSGESAGWIASTYDGPRVPVFATVAETIPLQMLQNGQYFFTEGLAYGINSAGDIAGTLARPNRAVVWQNGIPTVLGDHIATPGRYFLLAAMDINDSGQIVGIGGRGPFEPEYAFLLTPVAVPEPATITLALAGLLLILHRGRWGGCHKKESSTNR